MSDRYQSLIHTPVGQLLAKNLGLPNPVRLDRYTEGEPLVAGTVGVGGGRAGGRLGKAAGGRARRPRHRVRGGAAGRPEVQGPGLRRHRADLLRPARRAAGVLHPAAAQPAGLRPRRRAGHAARVDQRRQERVAQRALEGFTRSLGKEVGRGGTVQLVYVAPAADGALASTLGFLLSPKSAYVSGQVVRIGAHGSTGGGRGRRGLDPAARRQGRARHRRQPRHRRADRPGAAPRRRDGPRHRRPAGRQRAAGRHRLARRRPPDARHHHQGRAASGSPSTSRTKYGGVDIVVHNAGITRDKRLMNMKRRRVRLGDRGEPDRAGADHRRAAQAEGGQRQRPDHRRRLDRRHRRQPGPDQLRRVEGRRHRPRRQPRRRAARTASPSTRWPRASSRPR